MPVHDSFDPVWKMPSPDDTVAGSYERVPGKASDSARPGVIEYKGDGTAQLRSAADTKHNSEIPRGEGARTRWPSKVDEFDPVNLRPGPRNESLKHGKFDEGPGEQSS